MPHIVYSSTEGIPILVFAEKKIHSANLGCNRRSYIQPFGFVERVFFFLQVSACIPPPPKRPTVFMNSKEVLLSSRTTACRSTPGLKI
jgi:hypothetical protein